MTGEISNVRAGRNIVLAGTYIEASGAPAPHSPLHQLPTPPADFVGRTEDLAELRRAIRQGGATISRG